MSGPQGSDPTQQWQGSQPPSDPAAWGQQPAPADPTAEAGWGQQPAYDQTQYGGYQQPQSYPAAQGYPAADQYGQSPTAYGPASYAQPAQYDQQATQYGAPTPQYGQQPQYAPQAGQYGQQPQYGQYPQPGADQFSPYGSTGTEQSSKKSMGLLLGIGGGAVVLLLIVLGVLLFVWPGWASSTELDVKAANSGVQQILSDEENGYGAKNVENVDCNGGKNPPVSKGGTFTCDVDIDGTKREVTVTFQNDDGTYEVGRPR
jgi:hypothetical protein